MCILFLNSILRTSTYSKFTSGNFTAVSPKVTFGETISNIEFSVLSNLIVAEGPPPVPPLYVFSRTTLLFTFFFQILPGLQNLKEKAIPNIKL